MNKPPEGLKLDESAMRVFDNVKGLIVSARLSYQMLYPGRNEIVLGFTDPLDEDTVKNLWMLLRHVPLLVDEVKMLRAQKMLNDVAAEYAKTDAGAAPVPPSTARYPTEADWERQFEQRYFANEQLMDAAAREAYETWVREKGDHEAEFFDDLLDVQHFSWRAVARAMMLRGAKSEHLDNEKRLSDVSEKVRRVERIEKKIDRLLNHFGYNPDIPVRFGFETKE